jgi:hypothetical protein
MDTAGLGLKRKPENSQSQQQSRPCQAACSSGKAKKPKTLHEKRLNLQAEILRYGVAAIEKMYPRQSFKKVTLPLNL